MPQEKQAKQQSGLASAEQTSEYDFSRCKLCATYAASPKYKLKKTTVYACAACDFHFINHLDSLPSDPHNAAGNPLDRKARDYIESKLPANEKQLRENLLLVKRHVSLSGTHCLDIGAGAGLFAHLLAEEGAVVHGIEPQRVFREFAQQKFGIALNGETIDAPHWQQGFAGFFDVVTLWDVFEHVNFPAEALQDAWNVTKPGGWLFLDTPRRDALFYRISEWSYRLSGGENSSFLESFYSPLPFRHKQLFTLRQLLKLVENSGFSVTSMHSSFFQPNNKMVLVCRKL
jgi:2-polyprenyl-6-hydroxyphenyl methylase/3-demethylubiquinone-9 3-methyltransferase